ncbi:MAG: DUF981 family protein [Ilumatobacter sp.]|uniref:DUF981 family protein n=1 Tax=Ilumatobacter sp. TaxID=1967498 RepID=UPI003C733431
MHSGLIAQTMIDWENLPTYNTIMAVAAGVGLFLVAQLGREILADPVEVSVAGYSIAFGILGFLLTTTGLHMTLTWPLAPAFPFDNIVFGETALAFGVLLLAAAFFGWRRGEALLAAPDPIRKMEKIARPTAVFIGFFGFAMIAIGAAGVRYQLFAAPPEEPFAGWWFSEYPWVEAIFISGLWALIGVGAITLAIGVYRPGAWYRTAGYCLSVSGIVLAVFGVINYFSHIGLIVETM